MKHWLWLSVLIILLDQITKKIILLILQPFEIISVFPNVNLILLMNKGAAFSLLANAGGWQRWLFIILSLGMSIILIIWLIKLQPAEHWQAAGLALIIGGALGNCWDRIALGQVIDFIQIYIPLIPIQIFNPWPAFNLADSAISIGMIILLGAPLITPRVHS